MQFLPDIYVPCDVCQGARYNRETLQVRYKDLNIAEVLDLTVDEALDFFANIPPIRASCRRWPTWGLGYIHLGQPAPTLSGGEAQRVKLSRELSKIATGRTLYILDEPSVGLHAHDVSKLIQALNKLVIRATRWSNLFRITWQQRAGREGRPRSAIDRQPVSTRRRAPAAKLTGVKHRLEARIVASWSASGSRPAAHKVGAAFGCLVPRLVTGQFDPTTQKAVWPSHRQLLPRRGLRLPPLACNPSPSCPRG
jgi:hypothetical protein